MDQAPRQAAVIVIGTELTLGRSSETNSEYLGRRLSGLGCDVRIVMKLPDDVEAIADQIRQTLTRADVLVLTGGLGATHDDVTREALSKALERPLVIDARLKERLTPKAPQGADYDAFIRQAFLPQGAGSIGPHTGTAPGIIAEIDGKVIYALPGVPAEMKAMLTDVEADITARFGRTRSLTVETLRIIGPPEPVVAKLIEPSIKAHGEIEFNLLANPDEIKLSLLTYDGSPAGQARLKAAVEELRNALGDDLYAVGKTTLAEVVGGLLSAGKLTMGTAESITAGQIGAQVAGVSGSSRFFLGGIIAYDNLIKERLLNVSHETLVSKGAVSAETAREMAAGVRRALNVDIGLSITGIAGPTGATATKPIGLVFVGIESNEKQQVFEFRLAGDRDTIQRKAAGVALNHLRLFLLRAKTGDGR